MNRAEIRQWHDSNCGEVYEELGYSDAHIHRGNLLDLLDAIEEVCCEVEKDWEPSLHPAAQELIERIRELTE